MADERSAVPVPAAGGGPANCPTWPPDDLARFDAAYSLVLAARTDEGEPGGSVEIGVVVAQGQVFVRANRGVVSGWYRATTVRGLGTVRIGGVTYEVRFAHPSAADDPGLYRDIDAAYAAKYGTATSTGVRAGPGRDATVAILPAV